MRFFLIIVFGIAGIFTETTKVFEQFRKANLQFTAELYKELLNSSSENLLVCPLSAEVVLALAHAGANGTTAKQISSALHLPEDKESIHHIFIELSPVLKTNNEYNLTLVNRIYLANTFNLTDEYNTTATDIFGAGIESIDFEEDWEAATHINEWVENSTHNKIKNLITEDQLSSDVVALIINAVYLKADWEHEFDPLLTSKCPFFSSNNETVEVDMMSTIDYFNYYNDQKLKAHFLELPYKGNNLSMTVVLPHDKYGLPELENHISDVLVEPTYNNVEVWVSIPKYKIESSIKFKSILEKMGIKEAFTEKADLSGMGIGAGPLFIEDIIQKTIVEVEEEGTTAAASSSIYISNKNSIEHRVVADHPFLFYLKHKVGGILFIGRYSTP